MLLHINLFATKGIYLWITSEFIVRSIIVCRRNVAIMLDWLPKRRKNNDCILNIHIKYTLTAEFSYNFENLLNYNIELMGQRFSKTFLRKYISSVLIILDRPDGRSKFQS